MPCLFYNNMQEVSGRTQ